MIELVQTYGKYLGRLGNQDTWRWQVKLEADNPLQLELVESVIYTLPARLYEEPEREVTEADTDFALNERSTGVFELKATVIMKAGCPLRLTHKLTLFFPAVLSNQVYDAGVLINL